MNNHLSLPPPITPKKVPLEDALRCLLQRQAKAALHLIADGMEGDIVVALGVAESYCGALRSVVADLGEAPRPRRRRTRSIDRDGDGDDNINAGYYGVGAHDPVTKMINTLGPILQQANAPKASVELDRVAGALRSLRGVPGTEAQRARLTETLDALTKKVLEENTVPAYPAGTLIESGTLDENWNDADEVDVGDDDIDSDELPDDINLNYPPEGL